MSEVECPTETLTFPNEVPPDNWKGYNDYQGGEKCQSDPEYPYTDISLTLPTVNTLSVDHVHPTMSWKPGEA